MQRIRRFLLPYSLKSRLLIMLLFVSLTPLILIGSISYISMYSILENKAESGVRSNLHQVQLSLQNMLSQLNHSSQQLAFDGKVGKNLERYLNATLYEKKQLQDEIMNELSLITFTNPEIRLTFYYFADTNEYMFENFSVKENFDLKSLPVLSKFGNITYNGPHLSLNPWDGHNVLSIVREVELPERDGVYVYIETSFKLTESIIKTDLYNSNVSYLIIDEHNRVLFSENEQVFPVKSIYKVSEISTEKFKQHKEHYLFEETSSKQGWKVVAAIPISFYEHEIRGWILQFVLYTILSLAVSWVIAWIIWNTVYRPLKMLDKDMKNIAHHQLQIPVRLSNIMEFDRIHNGFEKMRRKIIELIDEVKQKEKWKARLEVEKLMQQINPHFLYNTLDTVRWLARSKGQTEIDKLVSTLNKVLHYNLSGGESVRIKDEIEALQNYVALQGIRYNFQFDVNIQADSETLDWLIPRFILQPLVENALYHGLTDSGRIEVEVLPDGEKHVVIAVKDDGEGMTEEEVRRFLDPAADRGAKKGFGIGLQYVRRIIDFQYGESADISIISKPKIGTTITLRLPIMREVD